MAGFGASGALMAGTFVVFVGLIGVVTFNTWPDAADLFGGVDRGVAPDGILTAGPPPPQSRGTVSPVKLPGGGPGTATRQPSGGGRPSTIPPGGVPGSNVPPGGSVTGPTPIEPPVPSPPPTRPTNLVSQVVSGAGNAVQGSTDSLGDALGGSDGPGLGGVVGGVGRTLNGDLQSLAGNP